MNKLADFKSISTTELPSMLFKDFVDQNATFRKYDPVDSDSNADIKLGYEQGYDEPELVLLKIPDHKAPEVFSWLLNYAAGCFPVSQFCRVMSDGDYTLLNNKLKNENSRSVSCHRWSNVVLGELLAQGALASNAPLADLSMSSVSASYSSVVARANIIYSNPKITSAVIGRLNEINGDTRFIKRSLGIDRLLPVWNSVDRSSGVVTDAYSLIKEISDSILSNSNSKQTSLPIVENSILYLLEDFETDSHEKRIILFNKIVELALSEKGRNNTASLDFAVAAAAFLVDRGTKHSFLVRRWAVEFPLSCIWFGLLAGIVGVRCWDNEWSRAIVSISKQIGQKCTWDHSSTADLSWLEFSWMSKYLDSSKVFYQFPRLVSRALTVEMFPGVSYQLRLQRELTNISDDKLIDGVVNSEAEIKNDEIVEIIRSLCELANKAQRYVIPLGSNESNREHSMVDKVPNLGKKKKTMTQKTTKKRRQSKKKKNAQ